jgi:MFS family permease
MKKYLLEVVVFVCGALVMVFELVGARILGPYAGTSLFVWTSLIGIILGSLSLGYFFGGKISDKHPDYGAFGLIILLAGIAILMTAISKDFVLRYLSVRIFDIRWLAVVSSIFLFAPGSFFMGMVSPFGVKLKLQALEKTGSTAGNLYAISTIGSIAGTFAAGFYLIPAFGSTSLVYFISLVLIASSLLIFVSLKKWIEVILTVFFLVVNIYFYQRSVLKNQSFVDVDTSYNRVMIYDTKDSRTGKPVKIMRINDERSSAMFLDDDELVFQYLKYYDLVY